MRLSRQIQDDNPKFYGVSRGQDTNHTNYIHPRQQFFLSFFLSFLPSFFLSFFLSFYVERFRNAIMTLDEHAVINGNASEAKRIARLR
jgi:predicted PurR-regulated permease PerM